MCDYYGGCPTKPSEALPPLQQWSLDAVGDFVESLADGGQRDLCPPGCRTPMLFNGSRARLTALGMDGAALHELLQKQSAQEAAWRHPNATDEDKANMTQIRAGFAAGLLPPDVDATRVAVAFFNRLHLTVRAAVQPLSPPPAPRGPPPSPPTAVAHGRRAGATFNRAGWLAQP